jgi:hypothetical protein
MEAMETFVISLNFMILPMGSDPADKIKIKGEILEES